MVKESMDLLELLRKRGVDGDVDFLREALRVLMDAIMDAEVSTRIGAEHGERSPDRLTHRNGYRSRAWDTRVGTMELRIPKLREGSYFPSLLEPRRRSEKALLAVIQQAYVEGVSTRRVDDLVKALGCEGISKSQVSRICGELDRVVDSFLDRPLDGVIRDNNFRRRVASRFLLPSGSYCLTENVTQIRSLPHNDVTKMRRQPDGRRHQLGNEDRGAWSHSQSVQRGIEEGQEPDARRVCSHSGLPQKARGQTPEARR